MLAFGILGFWLVEEKPLTPVHKYVPTPPPLSEIVFPEQIIGVLLLAVAIGLAFTVTDVVAVLVQPLKFVTVIV
jgi:hypothetical protein